MCLIFTEAWIKELNQKHGLKWLKPPIYHLATADDERREIREQIEFWLKSLSKQSQETFIKKFKGAKKSFEELYNELVVAGILMQNGYIPEYEVQYNIANKSYTPDWIISDLNSKPVAIFEVLTINENEGDDVEKSNRQIEDLKQHLSKIQSNVSLKISNLPSKKQLNSSLSKTNLIKSPI